MAKKWRVPGLFCPPGLSQLRLRWQGTLAALVGGVEPPVGIMVVVVEPLAVSGILAVVAGVVATVTSPGSAGVSVAPRVGVCHKKQGSLHYIS